MKRPAPKWARWAILLLVPLVCTVGTLFLLISDGGASYARHALDSLTSRSAPSDPSDDLIAEFLSLGAGSLDATQQQQAPRQTLQIEEPQTQRQTPKRGIGSILKAALETATQAIQPKPAWKPDPEAVKKYREHQRKHQVIVPGTRCYVFAQSPITPHAQPVPVLLPQCFYPRAAYAHTLVAMLDSAQVVWS